MGRGDKQQKNLKGSAAKKKRIRQKSTPRIIEKNRERDFILIVCEDSKATPNYLEALCSDIKLSTENVEIFGKECGNDPKSTYDFIKKEIEENKDKYDRAYWVQDKDNYNNFQAILNNIIQNHSDTKVKIIPAHSIPCVEVWFLFHFRKYLSPIDSPKKVKSILKKDIPSYDKANLKQIYKDFLKDRTKDAIENSKHVLKHNESDNPTTHMHILIEDLIEESEK